MDESTPMDVSSNRDAGTPVGVLIVGRAPARDRWRWLEADGPLPAHGPLAVPLSRWLVEPKDWTKVSDDYQTTWDTLKVILEEAFGLLALARLLIRCEHSHSAMYSGATIVTYVMSQDGRDALGRGDVAQVIRRRLPD